jgi:hypothetical protein
VPGPGWRLAAQRATAVKNVTSGSKRMALELERLGVDPDVRGYLRLVAKDLACLTGPS